MGVNLVNTADGKELINLMNDTVSEATLLSGETAHNAAGEQIVGQFAPYAPNLLDNGDFSVNQKGLTEYTEGGYTVDRWKAHKGLVLTKTDTGINLQNTTDGTLSFLQLLSHSHKLLGKTVTMSISVNGVVYTKTTVIPTTSPNASSPAMGIPNVVSVYVYYQADGNLAFVFRVVAGVSLSVEWAKLELGSVATPFVPPEPATELAKCQRYQVIVDEGAIFAIGRTHYSSDTSASCFIPLPVTPRMTGSVKFTGKVLVYNLNTGVVDSTGVVSKIGKRKNGVELAISIPTGFGTAAPCMVEISSSASSPIIFDFNL